MRIGAAGIKTLRSRNIFSMITVRLRARHGHGALARQESDDDCSMAPSLWSPVPALWAIWLSGRSNRLGYLAVQLSSSLGELAIWVIAAIWLSSYPGYLAIQQSSYPAIRAIWLSYSYLNLLGVDFAILLQSFLSWEFFARANATWVTLVS